MNAEHVDLILQYALLRAGEEDVSFERQLGPIHLLKYVYLADLAYAREHAGQTFTDATWTFFNFGPWAPAVHQRIEPALKGILAERTQFASDYEDKADWVRWQCSNPDRLRMLESKIPFEIRMELNTAVHRFKKDTPALLEHVYRTKPMLNAAPNETLDFTIEPPIQRQLRVESSVADPTARKLKKLREAGKALREREALRSATAEERFVPPAPRYDAVFEEGVKWLDSLAGEPFSDRRLSVEFDEDVWKSSARNFDDLL